MKRYDYLIVGAGLYGSMFAYMAMMRGKTCLVIDRNDFVGGFCHTEKMHGIDVHLFGAHIFRTNSKRVWDFVNGICEFVPFVNSPVAVNNGVSYNMPFNMNTFSKLWGVVTPDEALRKLESVVIPCGNPCNLEEYVLSKIGPEMYELFVRDYTEKQWGMKCTELPPSVMKRIPIRLTYDNNYYSERYQGIPVFGYTEFMCRLLRGADVRLGEKFEKGMESVADKVVYTGSIDELFDYCYGKLGYRSVEFIHRSVEKENIQGVAVVNHTGKDVPYTRTIEHKHFLGTKSEWSVISEEYPLPCDGANPSYPIPDKVNYDLYRKYQFLAVRTYPNFMFGGRLGEYRYYSMNDIIEKFV